MHLPAATQVISLSFDHTYPTLHLDGGDKITTKCLLIATGADYRRLGAEGCEQFEGRGVYYAATNLEAQMCRGSEVVVVGGGNSAGQAAVFLAGQVRKVYLVIRGNDLYENMSSYLAQRIEQTPNIELLCNTEVRKMSGQGYLSDVELVNHKTGETRKLKVAALFSFIGAVPHTQWLPEDIETRRHGLYPHRSGRDAVRPLERRSGSRFCWKQATPAYSPPATCAPVRSNALRPPLAKARWRCSLSTNS